jgi:hypothetical protein
MNWIIENMKRLVTNDLVVEVTYKVVAKDKGLIADYKGKVSLIGDPDSPDFIPFNELSESQVVQWVKSNVNVSEIENLVQTSLDSKLIKKESKEFSTGLPWRKNISSRTFNIEKK